MLNLISAAKGKLDDPFILEWAIRFYRNLPDNKVLERSQIETDWFNEFFIAQMIDRSESSLLSRLFNLLPPQHFSNLKPLLLKKWSDWPATMILHVANILAVIAPDQLIALLTDDLAKLKRGANIDPLGFSSIRHLNDPEYKPASTELIRQLADSLSVWQEPFTKITVISALLKHCQTLTSLQLDVILGDALKNSTDDDRRQHIFEHLFDGLFGSSNYLTMVFDRARYDSAFKLANLWAFFDDSAPLQEFDVWLIKSPDLSDILYLLETLALDSFGCRTVLRLLKDSVNITNKLPTALKTQLALAACIHGYAKSDLNTARLELADTVNHLAIDLEYAQWLVRLTEHLKTFDTASVSSLLISRLNENFDNYAAVHIAETMGELADTIFVEHLIHAINNKSGDFLCEAARKALDKIGEPAQDSIIAQWDNLDRSQKIFGLTVIQNQHNQTTTEFTTQRFSQLLASDLESTCELILAAPSEQLLELLKPELRRKQPLLDRAYYISARLLDAVTPEVEVAKERAFADHQRTEKLLSEFTTGGIPKSEYLYLELECPSCGAVNQYQAKGVILNQDDQSALLADEFPCASCNAEVEFKFTSMSKMAVFAELVKLTALKQSDLSVEQLVKTMDCRVDGQVMPVANAIAVIRSRIEANSQNAKDWFRLGHILSNLNRPRASFDAYQKAAELAPFAPDAQFVFANALTEQNQEAKAFMVLQTALSQSERWSFLGEFPNFGQIFADLYNHLRKSLGKASIPALHPSHFNAPKKIGRNDPCPCGSGKKFKKCCG